MQMDNKDKPTHFKGNFDAKEYFRKTDIFANSDENAIRLIISFIGVDFEIKNNKIIWKNSYSFLKGDYDYALNANIAEFFLTKFKLIWFALKFLFENQKCKLIFRDTKKEYRIDFDFLKYNPKNNLEDFLNMEISTILSGEPYISELYFPNGSDYIQEKILEMANWMKFRKTILDTESELHVTLGKQGEIIEHTSTGPLNRGYRYKVKKYDVSASCYLIKKEKYFSGIDISSVFFLNYDKENMYFPVNSYDRGLGFVINPKSNYIMVCIIDEYFDNLNTFKKHTIGEATSIWFLNEFCKNTANSFLAYLMLNSNLSSDYVIDLKDNKHVFDFLSDDENVKNSNTASQDDIDNYIEANWESWNILRSELYIFIDKIKKYRKDLDPVEWIYNSSFEFASFISKLNLKKIFFIRIYVFKKTYS
jgi:hypothetical protein